MSNLGLSLNLNPNPELPYKSTGSKVNLALGTLDHLQVHPTLIVVANSTFTKKLICTFNK